MKAAKLVNLSATTVFIWQILLACSVSASPLVTDDFETGNLKQTTPIGFRWTDSTYTSVTTLVDNPATIDPSTTYLLNLLPKINNNASTNHALKFNYKALQNWSEQRFTLGAAYPDLWVSYWLYVPTNFYHRTVKPTNNKLFAIWMDDYSSKGAGPTVAWEMWSDDKGGSIVAVHYSPGNFTGGGEHMALTQFLTVPDDRGQWSQIILHVKAATGKGKNDGVIETYKRRKSESTMTKLQTVTNADIAIPSTGPQGWQSGYFMGWSNPGYDQDTYFLVDNVEFLTSPPVPLPPNAMGSKPKAPQSK